MTTYRALISVPIAADSDSDAQDQADAFARMLTVAGVIAGHVELVAESAGMTPVRVVMEDDGFREQVPSEILTHAALHRPSRLGAFMLDHPDIRIDKPGTVVGAFSLFWTAHRDGMILSAQEDPEALLDDLERLPL
jgi:hypothetical protein